MSSRTGCFSRSPGLRIRPVAELQTCLVYRPHPPKLFRLNGSAWLVLELCEGLDRAQLMAAYRGVAGNHVSAADVAGQVEQGLDLLMREGMIAVSESDGPAPGRSGA